LDENHTTLLSGVGLFALLSQEQLGRIAHGIPAKSFEVGEHVFTPTYRGEVFFLLLEGWVRIYRLEAEQEVTISVLEAGEMFGEAAFTSREGKGSYAQAKAASKIAFLNRSTFYMAATSPGVSSSMCLRMTEPSSERSRRRPSRARRSSSAAR
jgi:CRP-like cAMP-binding protein